MQEAAEKPGTHTPPRGIAVDEETPETTGTVSNNLNGDSAQNAFNKEENSLHHPSSLQLTLIIIALCLAVFCQALDTSILATAIPRITDEFSSLGDVGWYGSGYLLANCATLLSYGKLYNLFPVQWVFLGALAIFELGSLVSAATPTSIGLVLGRVLQGVGAGGILSGGTLIIAATVPLRRRPIFQGALGAMYAVASVAGPLMGGAFTEYVTWRLCFYINLPLGLISAIVLILFCRKLEAPERNKLPLRAKAKQLDPIGLAVFIPTVVCLLLAIMWGGTTYPWRDGRVIALFVLGGVLLIVFMAVQWWEGDQAMIPLSAAKTRTVWASCIFSFFLFGSLLVITFYLPIWFQAIKGDNASDSGIHILPLLLGSVIFSFIAGGLVAGVGYYTWACILSSILVSVGSGLMSTFTPESGMGQWIGYQAIYGAGIGLGLQQPLIAVQAALPESQMAEATALIYFILNFGGAVFLSVGQNIFSNQLVTNLASANIPNLNPDSVLRGGATSLAGLVSAEDLPRLRTAYNDALTQVFYAAVATAALSMIGSVFVPWYSVKGKRPGEKAEEQNETAAAVAETKDATTASPSAGDEPLG
ncbi:major facilitator superfamily domain-containing protein [Podospora australis]|uniref:Major facilitator superfamily domain-containing protein n=1 Tax=Podospora australis TaxID=1536484 RepID=A0AAN7AG02_9PEZI|nr:major facilitator superfamily domain-containing protein [Podospora australis]